MPSPIGHSLAGLIVAWTADLVPGDRRWRTATVAAAWYRRAGGGLTLWCMALAAMADLDLLLPTGAHRAYTHSIGAVILIASIAAVVTGWVTSRADVTGGTTNTELAERTENVNRKISVSSVGSVSCVIRIALMCGAAYASHVLLDWMAVDGTFPYGIRALWPFSSGWYISGWDIFPGTARRELLSHASLLQNARAVAQEIVILGPLVAGAALVRSLTSRRRRRRRASQ